MKFSTKLSIVITVLFLVSLCAMFYLGYTSTTGIVEQDAKERLEGEAFQIIDKIDRMLFERLADIRVLATDPVLRSRTSTVRQINQRLDEYRNQYRVYSSLSFFNMDRVRLADTSGKDIGKKHALTPYWTEVLNGKDAVMAITEAQATKQFVIHFIAAVRGARGRRIGVVASRMPVETIYRVADQTVRNLRRREALRVELMDAHGLLLYSSYHGKGMLRGPSSDWDTFKGQLARGVNVGSARHAFGDEEEEITAFAREQGYDTFKGNGWILTVCVPVKTAFAAANEQAKKFTALFLGIGILVILSTLLVSRTATKPLYELSLAAAEIGKGARDVSVKVRSQDEVGQLAKAFNDMVRDLKESEGKYKDLAELLPQIVFEVDAKGTVTFVNRHGLKMFGYAQQDIERGLSFLDVFVPEDRARLTENLGKRLGGEKGDSVEYTAVRKDGSTFPFLVFTHPIRSDDRILGIRGIGIDITGRKREEDELRQREWQLAEAQRIAHLGSWVWKVGEDRAAWTDELYRMLGLNPGEVEPGLGTYLQFVHPDDRTAMDRAVSDSMTKGLPTIIEQRVVKRDGTERFFHSQTDIVRDGSGKPVLMRGVVRDITESKQRENELRESEEKLRTITATARDAIIMMDQEGKVSYWNPAAEKIFGFQPSEAIGKELHSLIGPTRYYDAYRKGFARFQERGEGPAVGKTLELGGLRKDGTEFPVELSLSAIEIKGAWHAVGTIRDIADRKKAEQDLQKFKMLIENSSDFIGIGTLDGKALYLNRAGRALVGLGQEDEIAGRSVFDFYSDEAGLFQRVLCETVRKTGYWHGETLMKNFRTGEAIPVEMNRFVIKEPGTGRPIALAVVNHDISERKQAEQALKESEERYRTVVDNVNIGIALISPKMEIVALNRQMREWSPAIDPSQRPICFRSFNRPPREEICSYCPTVKTLRDGLVHESITETPTEGGIVNYRVTASPLKDTEGNVVAAIELVEDITERKRWEDEIRRLNQELESRVEERTKQLLDTQDELVRKEKLATLGQLAGTVGHELRNPLGVMNNAVYFLQTVLPDADETTKEYLGIIKKEIFGAERIVSDLLDAVRTRPPHPQLVLPEDLVRMSLEKCRIPERVRAKVISATRRSVLLDPLQLTQVFINLISNGLDAMPGGGTLKITAEDDTDAFVRFVFKDEGVGIAAENMAKLFQPLFTTKARGIGLGLVVVKNLTEANGGKITVQSEVGKGTIFTIRLPAGEA